MTAYRSRNGANEPSAQGTVGRAHRDASRLLAKLHFSKITLTQLQLQLTTQRCAPNDNIGAGLNASLVFTLQRSLYVLVLVAVSPFQRLAVVDVDFFAMQNEAARCACFTFRLRSILGSTM